MTTKLTVDPLTIQALQDVDTSPAALLTYRHVDVAERRRMLCALYLRDKETPSAIAEMIGLNLSSVTRQLALAGVRDMARRTPTAERRKQRDKQRRDAEERHAKRNTVPNEGVRIAKELVRTALQPLSKIERDSVLSWARDVLT